MEKAGFIQRTQSWYIIAKYLIKINPKNKRNMHSGLLPQQKSNTKLACSIPEEKNHR